MSEIGKRFAEAVKFIRKNGLAKNDTAVARALGITCSTVSMIAAGTREPTAEQLIKLCDTYPISLRWLRKGEGDMVEGEWTVRLLQEIEQLNIIIKELEQQLRQIRRRTAVSCK